MNIAIGYFLGGTLAIIGYMIPNTDTFKNENKVYNEGDILTEQEVKEIISLYATGTKAYQMLRTAYCESGYKNIQSNIIKNGKKENSWGLGQIYITANTRVSKEQALDPYYNLKFMSDNWSKDWWYGYNRKSDTCNLIYK